MKYKNPSNRLSRFCIVFLLVILLLAIAYYGLQVWFRHKSNHWYTELSTHDGGKYTLMHAYVGENWISLKLYRTGDARMLAERTYQFVGPAQFLWTDGMLIYDTSDDSFYYNGSVKLPPTKLDKFLAHLP